MDLTFEAVSERLAAAYRELAEVKVQYLWLYNEGYQRSHETSVSGRERSAEIAAQSIKEDEIRLEGNIAAMLVERDMLRAMDG